MKKNQPIALFGAFTALAFIFSYLESLIPVIVAVPGMKLGLANLIVVLVLYSQNSKNAFCISLVRILLVGFTFGNLSTMLYSLAGGLLSFLVMILAKKVHVFSILGVSILGACAHNVGQILVALLVIENHRILYYLPFLTLSSLVTGALIGWLSGECLRRLPLANGVE